MSTMSFSSPARQQGLTLVELMLAVVVMGVLMTVVSPMVSSALQYIEAAGRKEATVNNQKLAQAVLRYANTTARGQLPAPPASRTWGIIDDQSPDVLKAEVQASGVAPNAVNSTGFGMDHVKVYRVVKDQKIEIPLYFTTGTKVTLTYDVGVIYQTTCSKDLGCANNTTPRGEVVITGNEGTTGGFTAATLDGWDVKGEDYGPVMFNTLELQKDRLRITLGRINRLTDRLSSYYYARARAENAALNHFPTQADGVNPGTENCRDKWISLQGSDVLKQLGLDGDEFGVTAWGGGLQYCRDYNLTGAPAPAGGPYYAALRFNKDLSAGVAPTANNNAVVTF